jgi:hypothetical protein
MITKKKERRYPRVGLPKGVLVAWQTAGDRIVSRIETLGLGGLFIQTPDPPQVGVILKLFFQLPSGDVRARAIVRNCKKGTGMGVEFTGMGYEARGRLVQVLKRLLE